MEVVSNLFQEISFHCLNPFLEDYFSYLGSLVTLCTFPISFPGQRCFTDELVEISFLTLLGPRTPHTMHAYDHLDYFRLLTWGQIRSCTPPIMAKCGERFSNISRRWYHIFFFSFWTERIFSKAALFTSGLVLSHNLAQISVLTTLLSYIVHNWENQHLPKAAAVINMQQGLTTILAIIVAYIADSCTGLFNMAVLCNVSYIVGLMLYWVSASVLSPNTDIRLFYATALAVALGRSGQLPVFKAFLADQFRRGNHDIEEKQIDCPTNLWWGTASVLAIIIAYAISTFTWATKFLICALVMVASLLLFLSGFTFYYRETPTESPLYIYFGVFRAAISKMHLNYPNTPSQYCWENEAQSDRYYENHLSQILLLPKYQIFRWLDKAAIREEKFGRLCTVEQVRDVKHLLTLIPMWITFFAYGIVKANGHTFFIKQSSNMDVLIGKVKVPLITFPAFKSLISTTTNFLLVKLFKSAKRRHLELVAIGAGMVCSILCCITAWQVEIRRLYLLEKEGIGPSNPKKIISMSVFWLLPQFFLLGLMEGLAHQGLKEFISNHVSKSVRKYGPVFSNLVTDFGNFFSILIVLLCKSWFKDTINTSHLDRYFLFLAILCSVFLCIYLRVSLIYAGMEDLLEDTESDDRGLEDGVTLD